MTRIHDANVLLWIALLIVSLPAATVGAAAIADDPRSLSAGGGDAVAPAVEPEDYDATLDSRSTNWAGQALYFDGSEVVDDVGTAPQSERVFQLRQISSDGEVGGLVREFVVDSDGEAVLDTAPLDGRYVVRYQGETVYVQDGSGYTDSPPDGSAVTVENSAWDVAEQTISASWSDDRVSRNDEADLRIESNRARFRIAVSADGLDFDDLEALFDAADYAPDHDARADEDVIVLQAGGEADLSVSFAGIDDGEYTLAIEVVDAAASTTADVRVGRTRTTTTEPPATTTEPSTTEATTATESPTADPATASTPAPTGTVDGSPTTETTGQPGFGVLVATVAVLVAVLFPVRRRG